MSDASGGPVTLSNRVELRDVLRGFAVGGILLSNIGWYFQYGSAEWVWRRLTYRQPLPLRVQRDVGRTVM